MGLGLRQTLNLVRLPVLPIRQIEVEADYPEFVRRSQATGFINESAIHVRPSSPCYTFH